MDPGWPAALEPDWLFVDTTLAGAALESGPGGGWRGGWGLGLVPTSEPLPDVDALAASARGLRPLLPRALVTASCGLGTLTEAQAAARLRAGAALSARLRAAVVESSG